MTPDHRDWAVHGVGAMAPRLGAPAFSDCPVNTRQRQSLLPTLSYFGYVEAVLVNELIPKLLNQYLITITGNSDSPRARLSNHCFLGKKPRFSEVTSLS